METTTTAGENLHSVTSPTKSAIQPKIMANAMSAFNESNICDKINAKVAASVVKQKSVFTSNSKVHTSQCFFFVRNLKFVFLLSGRI